MIVVDSMHMEHKIHHDHGIRREDVVPAGRGLEFAPPPRDTEGVRAVFELVGAVMFPTVLGWTVLGAVRATRWWSARRQPAAVTVEPIERLCATVCRLHAALAAEENRMGTPAKVMRVRARRAAYLDVLSTACQRLEVRPPTAPVGSWVPLTEIYRAEAALRERGLDVRQALPLARR